MPSFPAPQQQYLPQHQTLSYGVDWRVFPAGTATFHLESDGTTQTGAGEWRLDRRGEPVVQGEWIAFSHHFDRRTGCSQTFAKQLQEGPAADREHAAVSIWRA